MLYGILMFI